MKRVLMVWMFLVGVFFNSMALGGSEGGAHEIGFPQPKPQREKGTPPNAPKLLAPSPLQSIKQDTVTLKWQAEPTATHYHVQVAKDPQFKWLLQENKNVTQTELTISGLPKGWVFWRVFAANGNNQSGLWKSIGAQSSFEVK